MKKKIYKKETSDKIRYIRSLFLSIEKGSQIVSSIDEALIKMDLNGISFNRNDIYGTLLFLVEHIDLAGEHFNYYCDRPEAVHQMFKDYIVENLETLKKTVNIKQLFGTEMYNASIDLYLDKKQVKYKHQTVRSLAKQYLNKLIVFVFMEKEPKTVRSWKLELLGKNLDRYSINIK